MIVVLLWHTSCLAQDLFFSSVFKLEGCRWDFPRPSLIIFIWFHLNLFSLKPCLWRKFFPSSNVETACLLFSESLCHYNKGLGRRLDTVLLKSPFYIKFLFSILSWFIKLLHSWLLILWVHIIVSVSAFGHSLWRPVDFSFWLSEPGFLFNSLFF